MPVIPAFGGLGGELGVPGHPPSAAQGVCARVLTQKSKNKKNPKHDRFLIFEKLRKQERLPICKTSHGSSSIWTA